MFAGQQFLDILPELIGRILPVRYGLHGQLRLYQITGSESKNRLSPRSILFRIELYAGFQGRRFVLGYWEYESVTIDKLPGEFVGGIRLSGIYLLLGTIPGWRMGGRRKIADDRPKRAVAMLLRGTSGSFRGLDGKPPGNTGQSSRFNLGVGVL
jgi:hypothetical protein